MEHMGGKKRQIFWAAERSVINLLRATHWFVEAFQSRLHYATFCDTPPGGGNTGLSLELDIDSKQSTWYLFIKSNN